MLSLGFGGSPEDPDRSDNEDALVEKMMLLLQEHGWDFTLNRDPVLILIEIEEYLTDPDKEE